MDESTGYIIMTSPLAAPPQGDGTSRFSEPVRWYWKGPNRWTSRKESARTIRSASDAVERIGQLRRSIDGVEFSLAPLAGAAMDVPASRHLAAERERKPPHETR